MFRKLLPPKFHWSVAVGTGGDEFPVSGFLDSPSTVFSPPRFSLRKYRPRIYADPFLLVNGENIFLFMEEQRDFWPGRIVSWSSSDGDAWRFEGIALEGSCHYSYPNVFKYDNDVWMIPESAESRGVSLFRSSDFPLKWERVRTLVDQPLRDPSIIHHQSNSYMFATDPLKGLRLFISDSPLNNWREHPASPLTSNPVSSRSGGNPFHYNGDIFRIAQDCSQIYGGQLHLYRVLTLNPNEYREELFRKHLLPSDKNWNQAGGHHLCFTEFKGKTIYAWDGQRPSLVINNLSLAWWRLLEDI